MSDPYKACPYAILRIRPGASQDEMLQSYRRLVRAVHPDKCDSEAALESTIVLNHARDRLLEIYRTSIGLSAFLSQERSRVHRRSIKLGLDRTSPPTAGEGSF